MTTTGKPKYLTNIGIEDIIEGNKNDVIDNLSTSSDVDSAKRKKSSSRRDKISFEIKRNYGSLSNKKRSVSFALVDWGGYLRYDIRAWNEDYTKPYKGISLTKEEALLLQNTLDGYVARTFDVPIRVCTLGEAVAKIYCVISILSTSQEKGTTWNKQISIIDWGYGPKYDIRKWPDNYSKCGKGICLSEDEIKTLRVLLHEALR